MEAGQHVDLDLSIYRSVDPTGWIAADLHVHAENSHDSGVSLEDRIGRSAEEQRLSRAALAAVQRRLDELGGDSPGRDEAEHQLAYLKRALADLDRELSDLRSRRDLRRVVAQITRK